MSIYTKNALKKGIKIQKRGQFDEIFAMCLKNIQKVV
jgi:hypothetical protein